MTTTICLSFDFDAVSIWVSTFRQNSPGPVSRGEYGANVGLGRILRLLERKGVKATFFTPSHTAVSFPEQVRAVRDAGHEIAVHGYAHESPVSLDRDVERDLLDRAIARLRTVLGEEWHPVGYRSPAWDISAATLDLLVERGFLYDSSLMGDDFRPYRARRGDCADEDAFRLGMPTRLVEIPVAWELDDFPYFAFINRPLFGGLRNPADVLDIWAGEFDWCHRNVESGVFTLTMHPQFIGRGPRIEMLSRLVDHMAAAGNVRFSTLADEALRQDNLLPPPPPEKG